ncbi:MAG: hypothetical protein WD934_08720 [Gemmatimonadales bacterium]
MLRYTLATVLLLLSACTGAREDAPSLTIADVGFATPESVLHDADADRYLVSNINGSPLGVDGNGFISRVRPDGTVDALKWIDGATEGVMLNAPKGMALVGDTLFVSDITVVRMFHRNSGAPLGERAVPGATFLNDVAAGPDGRVYVTDSGLDSTFASTGTDALWMFVNGEAQAVIQGPALGGPNGITVTPEGVVVVGFGTGGIIRVLPGSNVITELPTPDGGGFDGVERMGDGSLLVSSWGGQAVFRIAPDGTITTAVDSIPSPADIGWDAGRQRVLIPVFTEHRVEILTIH